MSISEDEILAVLNVYGVIKRARMQPYTTKSDFARMAANEITGCFRRLHQHQIDETLAHWMVTHEGFDFMDAVEQTVEGLDDVPSS